MDARQRLDTAQTIDIAAIASQVLAALDHLEFFVGEEMGRGAPWAEPAPCNLEEVVTRLERVERHVSQLRQQMQALPAYMLRLERWSLDAEARLNQLDGAAGPALKNTIPPAMCPTAMSEAVRAVVGANGSGVAPVAAGGVGSGSAPTATVPGNTTANGLAAGEQAGSAEPMSGVPAALATTGGDGELAQWRSVKEVAQALSLKESTVRRYIRQGRLPAARLPGGRGLRVRWDDVLAQLGATDQESLTSTQSPVPGTE